MARSVLRSFSASANASTMVCGASGLPSVSRPGLPSRWPTKRLNSASSSWQAFSTMRVMLPVSTDSSMAVVSTSVSLDGSMSLLANSWRSSRPAMRSSTRRRRRVSKSDISAARSVLRAPRASRYSDCSARMSELLARSISTSLMRSNIPANVSCRRWMARSRQSESAFASSRGSWVFTAACFLSACVVAFIGSSSIRNTAQAQRRGRSGAWRSRAPPAGPSRLGSRRPRPRST